MDEGLRPHSWSGLPRLSLGDGRLTRWDARWTFETRAPRPHQPDLRRARHQRKADDGRRRDAHHQPVDPRTPADNRGAFPSDPGSRVLRIDSVTLTLLRRRLLPVGVL